MWRILNIWMFVDDTNHFFLRKNIKELFHTVNLEITNVFKWFNVNKLSLDKD